MEKKKRIPSQDEDLNEPFIFPDFGGNNASEDKDDEIKDPPPMPRFIYDIINGGTINP